MMNQPNKVSTGFRCSLRDIIVLLISIGGAIWLWEIQFPMWWLIPMVVLHFFLFCNIVLLWQRWELIWAAIFVCNVGTHVGLNELHWVSPLLVQLPFTIGFCVLQIRSPWYRGVWADRINPKFRKPSGVSEN